MPTASLPGPPPPVLIFGPTAVGKTSCIERLGASLDVPITKGCGGFLVMRPVDLEPYRVSKTFPCISCGKCVEACPMHLNPCQLGKLAVKRRYLDMDDYHLFDCFECGCCSYVCPAGIPLVQYFRVSKAMNRELKAAKK